MGQAASFARDDRVFKALQDRLNAHKAEIREKCSRRLKWQFRVIQAVMDSRSTTLRVCLLHSFCEASHVLSLPREE